MATLTKSQILIINREACERILHQFDGVEELEPLRASKLHDTPFDVIVALVWAYRRIEELETETHTANTTVRLVNATHRLVLLQRENSLYSKEQLPDAWIELREALAAFVLTAEHKHILDCNEFHEHRAPKCCGLKCWCRTEHEAAATVIRNPSSMSAAALESGAECEAAPVERAKEDGKP